MCHCQNCVCSLNIKQYIQNEGWVHGWQPYCYTTSPLKPPKHKS